MNNMIPQLVCDKETAICYCTSSLLIIQFNISVSPGFSCFNALLKVPERLDNDDFPLLLPPLYASSNKK